MQPHLERAFERVPVLAETGVKLLFCGPESFTADHNYLMGEAPNLKGFFVAAGFNSLGILSGGGVGLRDGALDRARPCTDGCLVGQHPPHPCLAEQPALPGRPRGGDRSGSDIRTIGLSASGRRARGVKSSVLHDRVAAAGACFGESAGWERPNWYARPGQTAGLPVWLGTAELVRRTTPRNTAPYARPWACSSNPPSRRSSSRAAMPSAR